MGISFTRRLREPIRRGEITVSIRFWHTPRVKVGERYAMEGGHVTVTGLQQIQMDDITDELARQSGFPDVPDMLKIAKHGSSDLIWRVDFEFEAEPFTLP